MTPQQFLLYSVIGLGDLFVLLVLFAALAGFIKSWAHDLIQFWFAEQEKFMRRMAGVKIPMSMSNFDN